ncbi:MAG: 8-amino-7-oxononanoate synthase [Alphaproteobacteria bacterium]|nr:8-amino-7-oxononanoate synthase [Alphaproteobacteria bacterium]MCD8519798.1 8-amino-7-oxononanoate synthase [Alphaproteobacteria bacterium]MCD8525817.1 8-amino-7-oxononanoate synthase [Alphaproteobacteria bacterium]MCD8571435.1 8-amino-7-oxononanoate synthase [Alphaproteobacteria bacterium]
MNLFLKKLAQLEDQNRLRSLKLPGGIDFSSNDYLGFRSHPSLKKAAIEALENGMDLGSGGSRLLRGHTEAHQNLEEFAARYYGCGKTLYFANGFMANYALFTTLPTRHDVVVYDAYTHASVRDGIHAGTAKSVKVPHNDLNAFEDVLKRYRDKAETLYIAIESVYSMDGDFAPLSELYKLAQLYEAILIIDEAHGTGVWGKTGKGVSEGLPQENLVTLHTGGKALGVAGGLICASADIIDMLINTARPFIYSTAPPPLQAYLMQKALELSASDEGCTRRNDLRTLCTYAQEKLSGAGSQIIPIILGDDKCAVDAASDMQKAGYDIRAIRPPTVPENTARLRLSLNAQLTKPQIDSVISALADYLPGI